MEGNEAGTMDAGTEVTHADGSPHNSQRSGQGYDRAGAREPAGSARARLLAATVAVLADASDPRLIQTGVTRTPG
jgi:hypothetical protein